MTVVISEFEVVTEPLSELSKAGSKASQPTGGASSGQTAASTPHDIENILRRQRQRLARLRAH